MGDGEKSKNIARTIEMGNLSLEISSSRLSRDLLQRFMGPGSEYGESKEEEEEEEEDDDDEIELNLGLSLGGRFGVDKSWKKLVRSSSIASCLPVVRDDNDVAEIQPVVYSGLVRTSSLPLESEDEWRKRKELQTLRRMEAKRRRSEKQRNLKSEKEGSGSMSMSLEEKKEIEVNLRERLDREKTLAALNRDAKGKGSSCAKGVSDLESKSVQQGSSGEGSPRSIQECGASHSHRGEEMESKRGGLEDMPCVFAKGDGPNGRRVDGILYKYGKGEQVRIMCVCHGTFHSPAQFLKHAGGTDLDNPLKHIVVNPNASSLF